MEEYFETHLLSEICASVVDLEVGEVGVPLRMIAKYLDSLLARKEDSIISGVDPVQNEVKFIRGRIFERCCEIVCSGSGFSGDEQVNN